MLLQTSQKTLAESKSALWTEKSPIAFIEAEVMTQQVRLQTVTSKLETKQLAFLEDIVKLEGKLKAMPMNNIPTLIKL